MWKHIDTLLWKVNADTPQNISQELSFGGVCDHYIQDEHLREIGGLKSGAAEHVRWFESFDGPQLLANH